MHINNVTNKIAWPGTTAVLIDLSFSPTEATRPRLGGQGRKTGRVAAAIPGAAAPPAVRQPCRLVTSKSNHQPRRLLVCRHLLPAADPRHRCGTGFFRRPVQDPVKRWRCGGTPSTVGSLWRGSLNGFSRSPTKWGLPKTGSARLLLAVFRCCPRQRGGRRIEGAGHRRTEAECGRRGGGGCRGGRRQGSGRRA